MRSSEAIWPNSDLPRLNQNTVLKWSGISFVSQYWKTKYVVGVGEDKYGIIAVIAEFFKMKIGISVNSYWAYGNLHETIIYLSQDLQ